MFVFFTSTRNYPPFLIICFLIACITSCIDLGVDQTGQRRSLDPFTGIRVSGAFEVVLNQNGQHQVMIEADDDVVDEVQTEVRGGILHIERDWSWFWGSDEVTVYVDCDKITSITSSGASEITAKSLINADEIDIKVSGASDMSLDINAQNLEIKISGAGDVDLSGEARMQTIRISGSAEYDAQHLESMYANVKASGAGNAVVLVTDEIEANASGAGSIEYYGDPKSKKISSSGAGNIRRG
jgi:hypothetical protein